MNDNYRAGYEAGYFYGRIAALRKEPYDSRTQAEIKKADSGKDEKNALNRQ